MIVHTIEILQSEFAYISLREFDPSEEYTCLGILYAQLM